MRHVTYRTNQTQREKEHNGTSYNIIELGMMTILFPQMNLITYVHLGLLNSVRQEVSKNTFDTYRTPERELLDLVILKFEKTVFPSEQRFTI